MHRFVLVLTLLCAVACQSPSYEGRLVKVNFSSTPSGATVYVISWRDWEKQKGEELLGAYRAAERASSDESVQRLEDLLAAFDASRCDQGPTPIELKVHDYESIFMAVLGDRVGKMEFYPSGGSTVSLNLQ